MYTFNYKLETAFNWLGCVTGNFFNVYQDCTIRILVCTTSATPLNVEQNV